MAQGFGQDGQGTAGYGHGAGRAGDAANAHQRALAEDRARVGVGSIVAYRGSGRVTGEAPASSFGGPYWLVETLPDVFGEGGGKTAHWPKSEVRLIA